MYITKFNHITPDDQLQNITFSPQKPPYHQQNFFHSRISKKNSLLSGRPTITDRNGDQHEYSDTFRQMMNKVLNRICKKNNFLKIKKKQEFLSLNRDSNPKQSDSQIYQSLNLQNKMKKTANGLSKIKIKGVGRVDNDSNLLKKNIRPQIYNKTSVSFVKNKQFRKSIDLQKAKSMPSYGKIENELEKEKQNESILSNLERITFNNSFYPKVNEIKNFLGQMPKLDSMIPKFQARENYQKMQQVFKKELEPKHKKIQLAKKLFHKKMVQRQRNNERHSQSFMQKQKSKVDFVDKSQLKNQFQPWNTHEDIPEDMFKVSKRFPG